EECRTNALVALIPYLRTSAVSFMYPLWSQMLPKLASRTRHDLLSDLRALQPVILRLGGEQALADIFQAIQDVGEWWPYPGPPAAAATALAPPLIRLERLVAVLKGGVA